MEIFNFQKKKETTQSKKEEFLRYIKEQGLEIYAKPDTNFIDLLRTIRQYQDEFDEEILPNTPKRLINKVNNFVKNAKDKEIITLLKKINFDYKSILTSEKKEQEKASIILEAVLKAQSYEEVLKQNKNKEIAFLGFEDDPDISDVKEFIYKSFSPKLLQRCLISKIIYTPQKVLLPIENTAYVLPIDIYKQWEASMPEIKNKKVRARSFSGWNSDLSFSKKFFLTHIDIFSFYNEQLDKLEYLNSVSTEKRMRIYKLGTIIHEIAHHIYDYMMNTDERLQWKELVDKTQVITDYAKLYTDDEAKKSQYYNEFFAESIRLKITVPDYFKEKFPKINQFLSDKFSEIKS